MKRALDNSRAQAVVYEKAFQSDSPTARGERTTNGGILQPITGLGGFISDLHEQNHSEKNHPRLDSQPAASLEYL